MRPAARVPRIVGVDWCAALLSYQGAARELVARAKYRNQRAALDWLAEGMARLVPGADFVTWAPASPRHARERGFDHGELLGRRVAKHLGFPVAPLLVRDDAAPLTGRSAAERAAGPTLRARTRGRAYPLAGETVLVVDDVITTGATVRAAAETLRSLGATRVYAVAAAYTPVGRSALSPPVSDHVPCG